MAESRFRRIAVAVDGSTNGDAALESAIDLAKHYQSELVVLTVAPIQPVYVSATEPYVPPVVPKSSIETYRQISEAAVQRSQAAGLSAVTGMTYEGVVVDEILTHLERHPADLVVVGSRGLSTAKRLLLGSVSTGVVTHAPCPVLVVRPPPTKPASSGG
jgi:nucleotide-binding universal stress UspA family protein